MNHLAQSLPPVQPTPSRESPTPFTASRIMRAVFAAATAMSGAMLSHAASTCPFDTGGSDAINDGVVLTRYALGITGQPLVASTRYASLDPLQVKNNIECVGCALDMNGDGQIDTVDTTIIARHLAGFSGASLTAGLALGVGSRNSTAAVSSFLATGCATGNANAWVQGGNAFGTDGVIGTKDSGNLTVRSGGTINITAPNVNHFMSPVTSSITAGTARSVIKDTSTQFAGSANVQHGASVNFISSTAAVATISGGDRKSVV